MNFHFQDCYVQTIADDIENIKESCIYDVCMSNDPNGSICEIVSSYARQCQLNLHVNIPPWRTMGFCRMCH